MANMMTNYEGWKEILKEYDAEASLFNMEETEKIIEHIIQHTPSLQFGGRREYEYIVSLFKEVANEIKPGTFKNFTPMQHQLFG